MRWYGWAAIAVILVVGAVGWIAWGYFSKPVKLKPERAKAEAAFKAKIETQDEDVFYLGRRKYPRSAV
ncbi:MAG: hypothetical protein AAF512_10755 [Pseudomonadota bacterium]